MKQKVIAMETDETKSTFCVETYQAKYISNSLNGALNIWGRHAAFDDFTEVLNIKLITSQHSFAIVEHEL